MILSVLFFFQHIHKKSGQIIGVGRSADLVVHNSQCIMSFSQIQHSLDKILSIDAKYPGNTHNIILVGIFFYCKLALIFCLTVNIQRLYHRIIRFPGTGSLTVKHIVCA